MDQQHHRAAPRLRLLAAIGLGVISITISVLLLITDAISGNASWAHHPGASAAPLLLIAAAITAVTIARPSHGRHALIRFLAALAFAAWGIAQLAPGSAAAGDLNDLAILLFVVDAGYAVIPDARAHLTPHRRRTQPDRPAPNPVNTARQVSPASRQPTQAGVTAPPCCAIPGMRCACTAGAPGA